MLVAHGLNLPVLNVGIPDRFIEHGSREDCLAAAGLDMSSIETAINHWWRAPAKVAGG
jgi:1-deoxy-D-xylulose-5-phosphate synthase